jgi:hypothetical protein
MCYCWRVVGVCLAAAVFKYLPAAQLSMIDLFWPDAACTPHRQVADKKSRPDPA